MKRNVPQFLALGDSYTIGEGVPSEDCWPVQLVRALRAEGTPVAEPEIIAETGWTTADLDRALTQRAKGELAALVTILCGVNNQYRGILVRIYRRQLRRLLYHSVRLTASPDRIVVISIPDWGVTPFNTRRLRARVARQIDAYNRATREEAETAGARWVDITDLSRADPDAVTGDGLHPNSEMYARWVNRILPVAREVLLPKPRPRTTKTARRRA
jgi:lysophospholipase L1-like esterase